MIEFHVEQHSGLPPYLQIIRQVRDGLRLGLLREGDRLPPVKELATRLAVNANTVMKAYRELDYAGLVTAHAGVGTFIRVTLTDASIAAHEPLRQDLTRWLTASRQAGLDAESIRALFTTTLRATVPDDR